MNKPREYDRNGKRIVPLTRALRAERRNQFRHAVDFYRLLLKPSVDQNRSRS